MVGWNEIRWCVEVRLEGVVRLDGVVVLDGVERCDEERGVEARGE